MEDQMRWSLREMFPADEDWNREMEQASEVAKALAGRKGHLAENAEALAETGLSLAGSMPTTVTFFTSGAPCSDTLASRMPIFGSSVITGEDARGGSRKYALPAQMKNSHPAYCAWRTRKS